MRRRLLILALGIGSLLCFAAAPAVEAAKRKPYRALKGSYLGTIGKGNLGFRLGMYPREVITMDGKIPVTCAKRPELKYILFGYGFVDNGGKPVKTTKKGRFSTSAVRPLAPDVKLTLKGKVSRKGKVITGTFKLEYLQNEEAGDKAGCVSPTLPYKVRFNKKSDPLIDG